MTNYSTNPSTLFARSVHKNPNLSSHPDYANIINMDEGKDSLGTAGVQNADAFDTSVQPPTHPANSTVSPDSPADDKIISSANLTPPTPLSAPLPTDPLHPIQTVGSGRGDVWINKGSNSNKKPLIIGGIILAVAALVGIIAAVLLSNNQADEPATIIGKISSAIIFDETAPVPIEMDNNYGYISSEDGSQVIDAKFLSAERFYGEYAVVKTGSVGNVSKTLIINRTGETVFSFDGDNNATYYDTENNLWIVDGDAHNVEMQKLSPENTIGQYIGNDYLLVMEESHAIDNEWDAAADDDGGSSQVDDGEQSVTYSDGYIANLDGTKIYSCNGYCSAYTTVSDGVTYAIVRIWGESSQIINLTNGEAIYTIRGTISLQDDNLIERNDNATKYIKIQNNQVINLTQPETAVTTISNAGEYIVEPCKKSRYAIKTIDGTTVSDCDIDDYYELSPSLYTAYYADFAKSPILIIRDEELQLFDMSSAQVIKTYHGQDVLMFDDSPFLHIQDLSNSESQVCNLLSKSDEESCMSLGDENKTVDGGGDYFTVTDGGIEHIYNAKLKEIR